MHEAIQPDVDDPRPRRQSIRAAVIWGAVFGVIQAAAPLGIRWLDPATVYALSLILIASIYIGFAVADGRPIVIAVESGIAAIFVLIASLGISGPAWILVAGLLGHGCKDLWQHRHQYVAGTRWWPPFCCAVDLVAALFIALAILGGML
jgi:hypothetical protein